ncbi:YlxM family DNA-binding protein [Acetitomaculum ruminis]|uniref:YlxM family DNA-binding protein n=1 Tax=Acetitomaculum ruminis TaxID=2382 RepID=UPI0015A6D1DA
MEERVRKSLLYDFYGELLTQHQKDIYEKFILDDLSLSEIAADENISRQGVYDLIKRCDKILNEYEEKLNLLEKFLHIRDKLENIKELTKDCRDSNDLSHLKEIDDIANEILEDF